MWCTYYVSARFWNKWGDYGYLSTTTDCGSECYVKELPTNLLTSVDCVQVTAIRSGHLIDARLNEFNTNYVSSYLWSSANFNNDAVNVGLIYNVWGAWK